MEVPPRSELHSSRLPDAGRDRTRSPIAVDQVWGSSLIVGIIGPYVLVDDDPPVLRVARDLVRGTRAYMDHQRIELPLVALIAVMASWRVAGVLLRDALATLADAAVEAGAPRLASRCRELVGSTTVQTVCI